MCNDIRVVCSCVRVCGCAGVSMTLFVVIADSVMTNVTVVCVRCVCARQACLVPLVG